MVTSNDNMDIHSLSRFQLEHLIDEYPWFTIARKIYLQKTAGENKDRILSFVKECSLHLPSKAEFIKSIFTPVQEPQEEVGEPTNEQIAQQEQNVVEKPRQYIVGGDYFSREDFKQLSEDGLAIDVNLQFSPEGGEDSANHSEREDNQFDLSNDTLFTETLAEIYANQELYSQAIDIYSKLILLYPEKSAYFATLIENIKNKIN